MEDIVHGRLEGRSGVESLGSAVMVLIPGWKWTPISQKQ